MKKFIENSVLLIVVFLAVNFFIQNGKQVKLFLIGDSTMADKPLADNPERGWGQMFPMFFNDEVVIENHAKNGRSTKSFIDEGRWKAVHEKLNPGDYVFIQFGHNDQKKNDPSRYADPNTFYRDNLLKFVKEAKEKGAIPVLITPVNRRKFDENNKIVDTHKEYSDVVRKVSEKENAALIDLTKQSEILFNNSGSENTKKIFLWIQPNTYKNLPEGKEDNTHFTQYGAIQIAQLVVDEIKKSDLDLKNNLIADENFLSLNRKVVGLDYHFNNEWKENKEGKKIRYHYIWEDEEFSGYSEVGKILTLNDAELTTLTEAPNDILLKKLDMFIIVDPDTPKETAEPNYIAQNSINAIVKWVKAGGVLCIFANDKGNSEFEHLNKLTSNFGIHFNEDSRNRVTGKEFDMGKFDVFPDHPIFKDVKKLYLKEISTLSLTEPAKVILSDNGDVIMASAEIGKGFVFAVGDPWLYNEYIDNRKLPEGFTNKIAAKNLFRWLLSKTNNEINN